MIQRTLVLMRNASNCVSQCRCDSIIGKVKERNCSLGSASPKIRLEHQPDEIKLFRTDVREALSERTVSLLATKTLSWKLPERQRGAEIPSFSKGAPPPIAEGGWAEFADRNPNALDNRTRTPGSSPTRAKSQPRSSNPPRFSVSSILSHDS